MGPKQQTSYVQYVYSGPQVIAEYEDSGQGLALRRRYVYGPGIDEPIAMILVDTGQEFWYFYHADRLGSVAALSQLNGQVVERYAYDVFGQVQILTSDFQPLASSQYGNAVLFTGRWWSATTGLYHYRFRDYSPDLGRFLQTDPLGYIDGMNLYQYCLNSPMNYVDPFGENTFGAFVSWIAGTGWDSSVDMGWSEAGQLGAGFVQGAGDGVQIVANEYTFGLTDALGLTEGSQKVCDYGTAGEWSQWFARRSRDAAIAAAGGKIFKEASSVTKVVTRATKGADGATSQIVKQTSRITGNTLRVQHRVISPAGKVIHAHEKFNKFFPF